MHRNDVQPERGCPHRQEFPVLHRLPNIEEGLSVGFSLRATTSALRLALLLLVIPRIAHAQNGVINVVATGDQIIVSGRCPNPSATIIELAPFETIASAQTRQPVAFLKGPTDFTIQLPRRQESSDRLYSSFAVIDPATPNRVLGTNRFVEEFRGLIRNEELFPIAASKKGLQVQMVDDALALGVKHAALNVNLSSLIEVTNRPGFLRWIRNENEDFYFNSGRVEALDRQVKTLSDSNVVISLILLSYASSRADINKLMLHPGYDPKAPNHLGAFNTATAEGVRYLSACFEFLAERYSRKDRRYGSAVNFIVGNEVNSHWFWYNMGRVSMEELAKHYLRAVRICHTAVRKYSANSRVYLSLEHHWNMRYPGGDAHQTVAGRKFVDYFNQCANAQGNFDWHIAFHPYPENLFNCRTWNDKTATLRDDTPRITFKNLEMLSAYLERPELLYHGAPRRVILSEQGFHSSEKPDGELLQAAAYAYAYYRVAHLPGIDSFILHRHVDHPAEGGLHLGLWRRDPASSSFVKKRIYEVFREADRPNWESAFAFALPLIGIKSWDDIQPGSP